MRTVVRYFIKTECTPYQELTLKMPFVHEFLKVVVSERPTLYVQVETESMEKVVKFCIVRTGDEIKNDRQLEYIDTYTPPNQYTAYHIFKIIS